MNRVPIFITGGSRCGKTTRLIHLFTQWVKDLIKSHAHGKYGLSTPGALVFAANDDSRQILADRLSVSIPGSYPVIAKTPLGFMIDEVNLFFPLIVERLNLKAQFPIRLRPETEQELATKLWRNQLETEELNLFGGEYRCVRRILDLMPLAGAAGVEPEEIPARLKIGLANTFPADSQIWDKIGNLIMEWRSWCLERGLLSYGLIYELYWRYLLPLPAYQHHLTRRYQAIFADDVDDYPAVSRDLCEFLIERGVFAVFTYNQAGKIRLGLNADPDCLAGLASRCQLETLHPLDNHFLSPAKIEQLVDLVSNPLSVELMPDQMRSLATRSRAELLRLTAQVIIEAVARGEVEPGEIVIIAPGLDDIGRYTLMEILTHQGIDVQPLNEQRPLISSPLIRALLTLLGLVYKGLGRLVATDAVAEMLVVLSQREQIEPNSQKRQLVPDIDPVRGGLLADYCYHIDLELPCLLPIRHFARWDRLGHRAVEAYNRILAWIEAVKKQVSDRQYRSPTIFLDGAIREFFGNGAQLGYQQLANLRELMETARHFWQVELRLRQTQPLSKSVTDEIAEFIQLLRRGTISANPYPHSLSAPLGKNGKGGRAVTLATIYQYRAWRSSHRWQFWLDAGSHLWTKGGASELFGAPLFWREWQGNPWMPEGQFQLEEERLQRILRDLLARATERVYLCHSELGVNGSEQTGPLLSLVHLSQPVISNPVE